MRLSSLLLSVPVLLGVVLPLWGQKEAFSTEGSSDEQQLRAAGLPVDGSGLVGFFRQRARLDPNLEALTAQVKRLGDADARVRAQAAAMLVGRGHAVLPILRRAANDLGDPEFTDRVRRCMQLIEADDTNPLPAAAARLLALRKAAGGVEALLAYLPAADNEAVVEESARALAVLAYADGRPHPALVAALDDAAPLRRAVAGAGLCRKEQPGQQMAVRKLLRDMNPLVRLRVALALVAVDDVQAVPVLIDLLTKVTPVQQKQVEELLQRLAGDWSVNLAVRGDDMVSRRIRRDAWAAWWRHTDGPALLAEIRGRTLSPADHQQADALITKLGDNSFDVRQGACAELVALGPLAVPLLRQATRSADPEQVRNAEECLEEIAARGTKPLPAAAVRLLALHKPVGALETLLGYLPFAEGEEAATEVQGVLRALAVREGQLDPALVQALDDKMPQRRAVAAEVILKVRPAEQRAAVRKLLRDQDSMVRLRVALALAPARDKDAIPVLIDSLAEEPSVWQGQALDLLYLLAGDRPPTIDPDSDTNVRMARRDAWAAWWKKAASTADLAVLANHNVAGYVSLVPHLRPRPTWLSLPTRRPCWVTHYWSRSKETMRAAR
jgi:HEAT repeat protein